MYRSTPPHNNPSAPFSVRSGHALTVCALVCVLCCAAMDLHHLIVAPDFDQFYRTITDHPTASIQTTTTPNPPTIVYVCYIACSNASRAHSAHPPREKPQCSTHTHTQSCAYIESAVCVHKLHLCDFAESANEEWARVSVCVRDAVQWTGHAKRTRNPAHTPPYKT